MRIKSAVGGLPSAVLIFTGDKHSNLAISCTLFYSQKKRKLKKLQVISAQVVTED